MRNSPPRIRQRRTSALSLISRSMFREILRTPAIASWASARTTRAHERSATLLMSPGVAILGRYIAKPHITYLSCLVSVLLRQQPYPADNFSVPPIVKAYLGFGAHLYPIRPQVIPVLILIAPSFNRHSARIVYLPVSQTSPWRPQLSQILIRLPHKKPQAISMITMQRPPGASQMALWSVPRTSVGRSSGCWERRLTRN